MKTAGSGAPESANLRQFFLLCAPALLAGIALRVALARELPLAYFNQDVLDFLETAIGMITQDEFVLHRKKTVLVPLCYWLLSLTKWPLAASVPLIQHGLGCVLIAVAALLGRWLFHSWRVLAPLLALLVAIDPNILFYEHFLMAESVFLFCIVMMAAAAAWYALSKSLAAFALCLGFFFLTACTRPEGSLFVLFPLLLIVLVEWRQWRRLAFHLAALLATMLAISGLKSGSEGGLLLYTWVVHLTPDKLRTAPDFPPLIADIRQSAAEDWKQRHDLRLSRMSVGWQFEKRRAIIKVVSEYLGTTALPYDQQFRRANKFCTRVAVETCLRHPFGALFVGLKKGIGKIRDATGGKLDIGVLREKPATAMALNPASAKLLVGVDLHSRAEMEQFTAIHYPADLRWFNRFAEGWSNAINTVSIPRKEWRFAGARWPTIPIFYIAALAGLIIATTQKSALRPWHISLGVCLACLTLVVFMTANVRGRFRFFLEPFWIIYFLAFADFVMRKILAVYRSRRAG